MDVLTIILFFIYTWGLGFSVTYFLNFSKNLFERNLMRIGIGLGVFSILSILFTFLRIPLDWKIFLLISIVVPVWQLFKKRKNLSLSLKLTKENIRVIVVMLLFGVTLFMYVSGSFSYPYLEDDDPWGHAVGAKYVAREKTVLEPIEGEELFQYMDPYPPAYDVLMGTLHQTSPEIKWTLKFFNSLIISFGIIFFYFFASRFIGNRNKALFATFVLFSIPCYLSHFIWAHAFIVTLFFPAFYCLERIKDDKNWIYPAALVIAGILVVQPTQAFKFGIMFLGYWLINAIIQKRFLLRTFLAGAGGFLLSSLWWGQMIIRYKGISGMLAAMGFSGTAAGKAAEIGKIGVLGTATRVYTFGDFFFAKAQNMINNPIGVGIFIMLLLFLSLIVLVLKYKSLSKYSWKIIALFWLGFTLFGIHGARLPVALFSFRFWMLFAIPVSLLCVEGMWFLLNLDKRFKLPVLAIVIVLILMTSFSAKYQLNTAQWGAGGGFRSQGDIQGYMWLEENLPIDARVFPLTMYHHSTSHIIGFNKYVCYWCPEERGFGKDSANKSVDEIYNFLNREEYDYLVFDYHVINELGMNASREKIFKLDNSEFFNPVFNTDGFILFRVSR